MNRKIFYSLLLAVGIAAILLSVAVFPFFKSLSLMFFYNKEYDKSMERYQSLYDQDDHSISVISPLIMLNLQYAKVDQAIALMEEYMQHHPESTDGWQYLGKLYLGADKPHHYLSTLEKLYPLSPSKEDLRQQLEYFEYYGNKEKSIWALEQLVKNYHVETWEKIKLVNLYASDGNIDSALALAEKTLENCNGKDGCGQLGSLYISFLLDKKEEKKALDFAVGYLQKHPSALAARDFATIFMESNQPEAMRHIVEALPVAMQLNPQIIESKAGSYYMEGDLKGLYAFLKSLLDEGKLPKEHLETLASLAMTNEKDPKQFEQLLIHQDLGHLTDTTLQALINKAYALQLHPLLNKLQNEIPQQTLKQSPVLNYTLETANYPLTPMNLGFYLRPGDLSLQEKEKVQLAITYEALGLDALAKNELSDIQNFGRIPDPLLIPAAGLFIRYQMAKEGLAHVDELKKEMARPPLELDFVWLLLASSLQENAKALPWLQENAARLDAGQLTDLSNTALQEKNGPVALAASDLLMARSPIPRHALLYANALILDGQTEKGLQLLKSLYAAGELTPEYLIPYLTALASAAPYNPDHLKDYHTLLSQEMAKGTFDLAALRTLGYSLADAHSNTEAAAIFFMLAKDKPFKDPDVQNLLYLWGQKLTPEQVQWIAARAAIDKGKAKAGWAQVLNSAGHPDVTTQLIDRQEIADADIAVAYLDALAALKNTDEIAAVLPVVLKNDAIPEAALRNVGYVLADADLKTIAAPIFFKLARTRSFDDPDTQALLFLWGDKPETDQIHWIAVRAGIARGKEKGAWLAYLNNIKQAEITYELVDPEDLGEVAIADAYIDALATLKKDDELSDLLLTIVDTEEDLKRLKKLGLIASGEGLYDVGELFYLKVLNVEPISKEALREIGIIYFAKAAFRHARFYLGLYLSYYEPVTIAIEVPQKQEKTIKKSGEGKSEKIAEATLSPQVECQGDYLVHYYYAEMFNRDWMYAAAAPYYYKALEELEDALQQGTDEDRLSAAMIQASIHYRLNDPCTAICLYEDLICRHPANRSIRTDYASMLVEIDMIAQAEPILFDIPEECDDKPSGLIERIEIVALEAGRTNWLQQDQQIAEALCYADGMLDTYQNDAKSWTALANIKNEIGLFRQSIEDYTIARWIEPDNEDIYRAQKEIIDFHRPYAYEEAEYRKTGFTQKERFLRGGLTLWGDEFDQADRIVLNAEIDQVSATNFVNPKTGVTEPFKGDRYRGDLSWTHYDFCGFKSFTQLYFSKEILGAGIAGYLPDYYGTWGAGVEYNRPYWDYTETLIDYGTRDRVFVERVQRVAHNVNASLQVGANRYRLKGVPGTAAETISWTASASYRFPYMTCVTQLFGRNSAFYLNYFGFAEYETWGYRRRGIDRQCFFPMAITNQEQHILEISFARTLCRFFSFEASYGYSYDRLSPLHLLKPAYNAAITWNKRPGLTFKAFYDHSPSTSQAGQDVDRYVLNLTYYY